MAHSQEVIIRERADCVMIEMSSPSYGAHLSPEQARALADMLNVAADRVEGAGE